MSQKLSLRINATRVAANKKDKLQLKNKTTVLFFFLFFFSFLSLSLSFFFFLGVVCTVSARVVHYNYQIFSLKCHFFQLCSCIGGCTFFRVSICLYIFMARENIHIHAFLITNTLGGASLE